MVVPVGGLRRAVRVALWDFFSHPGAEVALFPHPRASSPTSGTLCWCPCRLLAHLRVLELSMTLLSLGLVPPHHSGLSLNVTSQRGLLPPPSASRNPFPFDVCMTLIYSFLCIGHWLKCCLYLLTRSVLSPAWLH